ncbi:MAG: 16S rRNA (cytosine(1402)-N(4))-methyltransferase RsmH [Elusimicrobia bacterium]|nr:16S rRNA (cytosine(1402)-N(4))-methyltransferase RsmH [Elusimicrobiota bacterium]
MTTEYHIPVMAETAAEFLVGNPAGTCVDCTLGGGGHTAYLLERYPLLHIIGIDCDAQAIAVAGERLAVFGDRVRLVRDNFKNIRTVINDCGLTTVDGVLADLGVSSRQFDDKLRGFSFESPILDMRMDDRDGSGAMDLVNTTEEGALADILYRYGDERRSRQIARRIVESRRIQRITSGAELADIVASAKRRTGRTHPATTVFQALRIAVNGEMDNLRSLLDAIPLVVNTGGRAVVISYHSLEDRMVKQSFRSLRLREEGGAVLLTKKPREASDEEISVNPRSRSAKLRAIQL